MNFHVDIDRDLPDAGEGMCCMGAAAMGPGHCTCWEPVYDVEQQPKCAGPPQVRDRMCQDCAFRPDSPERQGDERYENSDEDGIERVVKGIFYCHQGMRRRLRLVHPSGAVVEVAPGAYAPPNRSAPVKADGTPAELCAGWWQARAAASGTSS